MASTNNGFSPLDEFGRLLSEAFDDSLDGVKKLYSRTENPKNDWDYSAIKILGKYSEEQKRLKTIQYGLEGFIHQFLAMMQDSKRFKINYRDDNGNWGDLISASDDILMELWDWLREYSKNGCIGLDIADDLVNKSP